MATTRMSAEPLRLQQSHDAADRIKIISNTEGDGRKRGNDESPHPGCGY